MEPAVERRGRFRDGPRPSRYTGEPPRIRIEKADIKLFHMLAFHYHYLSPQYVAPLWGRSYNATTQRMAKLRYAGYLRLSPEQELNSRRYYAGPLFYALAERGVRELEQYGYDPFKRPIPINLKHQVMIDQVMASIEIGVNAQPHLELQWWDKVLQSSQMPEATKASRSAYVRLKDREGRPHSLRADGLPFVLKRTFDGSAEYMFFIGLEADCHTRSIPDMKEKFRGYVELLEDKLYRAHFGARSFFVIVAAPSDARRNRLMEAWQSVTEQTPAFRKSVLFVRHPMFTSPERPRPTGHMVTEPLYRVGHNPIILSKKEA